MKVDSDIHKLRLLIPHWIEHNMGHASEFRAWAAKVGDVGEEIRSAAEHMEAANHALQEAIKRLGGPLEGNTHHDHTIQS